MLGTLLLLGGCASSRNPSTRDIDDLSIPPTPKPKLIKREKGLPKVVIVIEVERGISADTEDFAPDAPAKDPKGSPLSIAGFITVSGCRNGAQPVIFGVPLSVTDVQKFVGVPNGTQVEIGVDCATATGSSLYNLLRAKEEYEVSIGVPVFRASTAGTDLAVVTGKVECIDS